MSFFSWRSAILKSDLQSTTKLVLLVISTYMDDHGGGAFPATKTIASDAGLSERAVCTHIDKAREAGYIAVQKQRLRGRDWARNSYRIAFPATKGTERGSVACEDQPESQGTERGSVPSSQPSESVGNSGSSGGELKALNEVQCLVDNITEGTERGSVPKTQGTEPHAEGTEPDDNKALNDVQSNSPVTSPYNSPNTSTTHAGARCVSSVDNFQPTNPRGDVIGSWFPSTQVVKFLVDMNRIPPQFIEQERQEFVVYRSGRGDRAESWDAKFMQHCRTRWARAGQVWQPPAVPSRLDSEYPALTDLLRCDFEKFLHGGQVGEDEVLIGELVG